MTHETGKSMLRRSGDSRFATRYFVGNAIDVGSGDDSLANYKHMFPLLRDVRSYDQIDGDAKFMMGVSDAAYNCVHSSHCLEHMVDPAIAIHNWLRVCKPGGHLVIVVPDFEQYEQGFWPSRYNPDHKWSFSIDGKAHHPRHLVLLQPGVLYQLFGDRIRMLKIELVERGYDYGAVIHDQSLSAACEPAIEIICRKII